MAKRYVRLIPSLNVRNAIKEAEKARKVLGLERKLPKKVTCLVCYKKISPSEALFREGGSRGYWMCKVHQEQRASLVTV